MRGYLEGKLEEDVGPIRLRESDSYIVLLGISGRKVSENVRGSRMLKLEVPLMVGQCVVFV